MPTINLAYIAELLVKYLRKGAYFLLLASFWSAITLMWTSFVTAFFYFYEKIQIVIDMMSGGGNGAGADLVQMMFGVLNCIGFLDAFTYSKPALVSAVTFLLGRILFNVSLSATRYFLDSIKPLVN